MQCSEQDPYVKLTLHDGQFDEGGSHRGESDKTTVKDNAGGNISYHEKFVLNKPENMDVVRVQLFDSNVLVDELLGSIDIDLDEVYKSNNDTSCHFRFLLVHIGSRQLNKLKCGSKQNRRKTGAGQGWKGSSRRRNQYSSGCLNVRTDPIESPLHCFLLIRFPPSFCCGLAERIEIRRIFSIYNRCSTKGLC